ncbi:hypothetical protein ACFW81_16040 [Streptomyces angustmyceticus]
MSTIALLLMLLLVRAGVLALFLHRLSLCAPVAGVARLSIRDV